MDELLDRMSAPELQEWFAAFDSRELDPWLDLHAEAKADMRTGVIGAVMANLLGNGKRRFKPGDFAPRWSRDRQQQTTDDMKRAAMKFVAAFEQREQKQ